MKTITVTGNGNYNAYPDFEISGGSAAVKVSDIGSATITPQVDFRDDEFEGLLNGSGDGLQTITVDGVFNLQPLKSGMRLRFNVVGYTTDITITVL